MAVLHKFLKKKNFIKANLKLTKTDHFEVIAKINGVKGRFILDTGASNTCVGFDKIQHFNLKSKSSDIKAAGAGATDMKTQISKKNKLQIGKWEMKKLQIVLFDLNHVNEALASQNASPVDGIIGADVLKKSRAIIDYHKKTLYLKETK